MLAIPLIPPQENHSSTLSPHFRPRPESPPPTAAQQQSPHFRLQQQRRDEERKQHNARSPLALIAADEAAIVQRKAAIRNFGAYWIRPLGVSKTLQTMTEEEAERLEQAEIERQEEGLRDMEARQQLQEAQTRAAEAAAQTDEAAAAGEEVDLDDEIPEAPDADADADADDDDEDVTGIETENDVQTTGEVSFNEDSMMEGSHLIRDENVEEDEEEGRLYAEMEEAELTGAARDGEALGIELDVGMERDLDDSVPEAGSYQHTDTEVEDSDSSDLEVLGDSFAAQSARRSARVSAARSSGMLPPILSMQTQGGVRTNLQDRMRAQMSGSTALPRSPGNLNLSSSLIDSSFVSSSPVMQRGGYGGRGVGAARRRGRQS
nr:hypothetical protein CFP56_71269 [Quercus suber]